MIFDWDQSTPVGEGLTPLMPDSVSQELGFAMIPHWVTSMVGTELTVHDLAVYVYLRKRADGRTHEAFPGVRTIADDLGIAKSTAQNSVNSLRDQGVIEVEKRRRKDGQMTNHYHLPAGRVYRETVQGVPGGGTQGVPGDGTEQEPENKNQEQEPTMAPAALEPDPPWVEPTRTFPDGKRSTTDDGERIRKSGWTPMNTIHQWKHPNHGFRDLLWEATTAAFGEPATNRERQRRSKAVALFREAGCDPVEIETLKRAYELKMSHAANTDLAVAGHISNCRRWANEVTTIDPDAGRRTVKAELQERARLHLLEAGPGPEKEWMRQR